MTLIGNRPERRVPAIICQASGGGTRKPGTFHASRFTLRLSCLTLPALLLCAAGPALGAAADSATPYQAIVERNVFGLKPPAPPPDPETLKPPPPKLTLTGIMTIFGKKQALFKAPPSPAPPPKQGQPAEPPRERSYILCEGQREDGITVLHIDEVAKSVKLDAEGSIFTLTFPTNEIKTASSPGPGGIPSPTGMGGAMPSGLPSPRVIPGRPLRIPGMGGASSSATPISGGAPSASSIGSGVPNVSGGFSAPPPPMMMASGMPLPNATAPQPQQPPMTADEANVALAMQHAANQNNPNFPPAPPPIASALGEPSTQMPAPAPPTRPSLPPRPGMPMTPPPLPQ